MVSSQVAACTLLAFKKNYGTHLATSFIHTNQTNGWLVRKLQPALDSHTRKIVAPTQKLFSWRLTKPKEWVVSKLHLTCMQEKLLYPAHEDMQEDLLLAD